MTLLRRFAITSDIYVLFRKCAISHINIWNGESSFSVKKFEIPSPPKRPLTAYMIFCKENRKEVLKENPALSVTEQVKSLAAIWNDLRTDKKEPYEKSARKGTLLYAEEHKKYYESLTEEQKEELSRLKVAKKESRRLLKLKKSLKESGLPRPAISAYGLFVQSLAKSRDNIKRPTAFMKEVAEKWKTLSEDEKKSYGEQSLKDKKRLATEMDKWKKTVMAEGRMDLLKHYEELKGKSILTEEELLLQEEKKETHPKGKET